MEYIRNTAHGRVPNHVMSMSSASQAQKNGKPPPQTTGEITRVPSISGKAERLLKLLKTLLLSWAIPNKKYSTVSCFFFWKGGGVVLPTYLALSCIMAISLLIKQYLLWDRKRFDSKWLLERKYGKLYGHQRKEQPKKHRPTVALKQNVWNGCCCSILFIFY